MAKWMPRDPAMPGVRQHYYTITTLLLAIVLSSALLDTEHCLMEKCFFPIDPNLHLVSGHQTEDSWRTLWSNDDSH